MNPLKILIVEDDPGSMLTLESAIYDLGYRNILTADNSEDALELIKTAYPDLLLLDIEIKGNYSGVEVAQAIESLRIPIIFITGMDDAQTYQQAKSVNPYAYLLKPFNILTLETAIDNVVKSITSDATTPNVEEEEEEIILKDSLFIKNGTLLQKVKFSEIRWIQSEGNYCTLFASSKKHAIRISLSRIIKRLPADTFIRVHKSYMVQAALITRIDTFNGEVYVDDQSLPLGRTYKDGLLDQLNKI